MLTPATTVAAGEIGRHMEESMAKDIGPQYQFDDPFKVEARRHQSCYRANVLKVDYLDYGNRLTDDDGSLLLNYYDGLAVRQALRERYPVYSRKRDGDMLRSEHIPFNMLAPLADRPALTQLVVKEAFGLELREPFQVRIEWAPSPPTDYLDDLTSFDVYLQGRGRRGELVGIGIEVKYTERGYRIGTREAARVRDRKSTYWDTTRKSGQFLDGGCDQLSEDDVRQIWRNHLLGLAMVQHRDIERFVSVTLYPAGNEHFTHALTKYRGYLKSTAGECVRGCTFEEYTSCLRGDCEIDAWKEYLMKRYLFEMPISQQLAADGAAHHH
jgi:hypothetical protein